MTELWLTVLWIKWLTVFLFYLDRVVLHGVEAYAHQVPGEHVRGHGRS